MIVRLLLLALLASLALRRLTGRWPWAWWAISERAQAEAQARSLLGVARGADAAAILAAHRQLLLRVHPDRGGSAAAVHAADAARDLLLARAAADAPRP